MKIPFKIPFIIPGLSNLVGRLKGGGASSEDEAEMSDASEDLDEDGDLDDDLDPSSFSGKRRIIILVGAVSGLVVLGAGAWIALSGGPKTSRVEGVPWVGVDIPVSGMKGSATLINPTSGASIRPVAAGSYRKVSKLPQNDPLSRVPDAFLIEQGADGMLPKIGADGRTPFQVYARPYPKGDDRPRIAIIITELGMSKAATEAAIQRLPGAVTLAFAPYGRNLEDWVPLARNGGHELLLSLPLEPRDFPMSDPGPYSLSADREPEENQRRLDFLLSRFTGYIGVMSVMGSDFASRERYIRVVLEALKSRGLMYLDGGTGEHSTAPKVAVAIDMSRAFVDLVIDEIPSGDAIDAKLAELESIARRRAVAVAVAGANPGTLERLRAWMETLEGKELSLAPVSAIANKQFLE